MKQPREHDAPTDRRQRVTEHTGQEKISKKIEKSLFKGR
jgi:hypothetical protein